MSKLHNISGLEVSNILFPSPCVYRLFLTAHWFCTEAHAIFIRELLEYAGTILWTFRDRVGNETSTPASFSVGIAPIAKFS